MLEPYVGYVAVPVWDGERWRPTDRTRHDVAGFDGRVEMDWPDGFDVTTLVRPVVNIGETVRFRWDGGIREAVVRRITRHGGAYTRWDGGPLKVATTRYAEPPTYEVYWNGHGRSVREDNIIR